MTTLQDILQAVRRQRNVVGIEEPGASTWYVDTLLETLSPEELGQEARADLLGAIYLRPGPGKAWEEQPFYRIMFRRHAWQGVL